MSNNRRQFLKNSIGTAAAAGFSALPAIANMPVSTDVKKQKNKHWIWINPDKKDDVSVLKKRYKAYYDAGIRGILFEADSEKHYTEAKNAGLEAHRWNWTMNRGDVLKQHPEWSAISRSGESCVTKPPYVGYYKWLCPSKPEVQDFLKNEADTILSKNYIDGLHLDYIRFCDVVLPLNLWDTYKLDQRTELPAYDFCYCKTCRDAYAAKTGNDPLSLRYPDAQVSWRLFRYQAINNVVNELSVVAHQHHKKISAAVFPMPELARRMVRQDWTNWNLDMVFPMIYHGFYQEGVTWIGDAVAEGVRFLKDGVPLYAGLFLSDFNNQTELAAGIKYALQNQAAGICFFGGVTDEVLATLKQASS